MRDPHSALSASASTQRPVTFSRSAAMGRSADLLRSAGACWSPLQASRNPGKRISSGFGSSRKAFPRSWLMSTMSGRCGPTRWHSAGRRSRSAGRSGKGARGRKTVPCGRLSSGARGGDGPARWGAMSDCGSARFASRQPLNQLFLLFASYLCVTVIFPIRASVHRCRSCGTRWDDSIPTRMQLLSIGVAGLLLISVYIAPAIFW
jgi:hypothetical protein